MPNGKEQADGSSEQFIDKDERNGNGHDVSDKKYIQAEQAERYGSSIGQFIIDKFSVQIPTCEEADDKSACRHDNLGCAEVKKPEECQTENSNIAQYAERKAAQHTQSHTAA